MKNKETIFFSFNFIDINIVSKFYSYIPKRSQEKIYFHSVAIRSKDWETEIKEKISSCDFFVIFQGSECGNTQRKEIKIYESLSVKQENKQCILIELPGINKAEFDFVPGRNMGTVIIKEEEVSAIFNAVKDFIEKHMIGLSFNQNDDLPANPHMFDYEKK